MSVSVGYIFLGIALLAVSLYVAAAVIPGPLQSLQQVNTTYWDQHTTTVFHLYPLGIVLFMIIILFIPLFAGGGNDDGEE